MKSQMPTAAGQRQTLQKQAIYDALQDQPKMMTAEEVFNRVRLKHPNVSLGTVYRNLQAFANQGAIRRTLLADGKARYEITRQDHHHYLVCTRCGETTEVPWCPLGKEVASFMENCEFLPENHQFEIYGVCRLCRQQNL